MKKADERRFEPQAVFPYLANQIEQSSNQAFAANTPTNPAGCCLRLNLGATNHSKAYWQANNYVQFAGNPLKPFFRLFGNLSDGQESEKKGRWLSEMMGCQSQRIRWRMWFGEALCQLVAEVENLIKEQH